MFNIVKLRTVSASNHHSMKTYRRGGMGKVSRTLKLGAGWRRVISFMFASLSVGGNFPLPLEEETE